MFLSDLEVGQKANIIHMNNLDAFMRKKLLNMGFLPKAEIEIIKIAPLGDPIAVRCADTTIALRKEIIQLIQVKSHS